MARSMKSISPFSMHMSIILTFITSIPISVHSKTLDSDIEILRSIKESVDPVSISPSSFLNSWNFEIDPCESSAAHFQGILCTFPVDNSSNRISAIDLEADGLEGFVTADIGNLTELTILNLSKNQFRGPIPSTLSNLNKLTRLHLSDNIFTGTIPTRMDRVKKLEYLDVAGNWLSGTIPTLITSLRSLTYLNLAHNEFSGRIPNFAGLWQLRTLDLSRNQLYGNIPQLPWNLRSFSARQNILTGSLSSITGLKHLEFLDISCNRLNGEINRGILTSQRIHHVNVSGNRFMRMEVVDYTGMNSLLQVLDARNNRLQGHLPATIATYDNLTNVNLGNNLFSGKIPMVYGDKLGTPWRTLFLDHNYLEGTLPPQFSNVAVKIRGSVAHNCLRCPTNVEFCHGGQRPASECTRP